MHYLESLHLTGCQHSLNLARLRTIFNGVIDFLAVCQTGHVNADVQGAPCQRPSGLLLLKLAGLKLAPHLELMYRK
jgi:hypothetical protein